jgi:NAD-dependent deacetylase
LSRLILFTGAGISAESGIPTFRDENGLWHNHKIDEVCNILTWKKNATIVHDFYNARRMGIRDVQPNAAHLACKAWQDRYETVLFTQNIDDLFEKAGCRDVIHLHGRATNMKCEACGHVWDIGYRDWRYEGNTDGVADRCPECDSRRGVKPGVVFFYEQAPEYSTLNLIVKSLRPTDVIAVIGTSAQVVNIGGMIERRPGYKVLNNLHQGFSTADKHVEQSVYDELVFAPATEGVARIDQILREKLG